MKFILILLISFYSLNAQYKYDYIWLLGGNSTPTTDTSYQGFQVDFNYKPRHIYIKDRSLSLTQNNASICDNNGNLLMYTAGCNVWDRRHQPMPNGKINEGIAWNFSCKNGDYITSNGTLFIPDNSRSNKYFLIHKFKEYDVDPNLPGTTITKLNYSIIDMDYNNGYGDLIEKNKLILEKFLSGSDLTAVRHANLSDWWILVPGRANDKYYSIQFTDSGIKYYKEMIFGIPLRYLDEGGSQSCFSADGKQYARMTPSTGLFLMDFDRGTGTLSNFRNVTTGKETSEYTVGVAFSPNSRFVYMIYRFDIYQVDTWAQDLTASLVHIDSWDGYVDAKFWGAGFSQAMAGPDCKIYIRTGTSNRVMHVIHNPNEKGKACNFEQHGIKLPAWNHASIPNFVNYRLGYAPTCDSSMVMTWNADISAGWSDLVIYPNPVDRVLQIEIPDHNHTIASIRIDDVNGRNLFNRNYQEHNYKINMDVTDWNAGVYIITSTDQSNKTWRGKFIKK